MALRVPKKIKTFTYEDTEFGLRRATVIEMMKITEMTTRYQRSIKQEKGELIKSGFSEIAADNDAQGDSNLLFEAERYIARHLTIDPTTGDALFKSEAALDEIDSDFVIAAWKCYTTPDQVAKKSDDGPLVTEATTTSSSAETSSESQNTSESTLSQT